ncbi:MAG: hypothetical protein ACOY3Y_08345, partial [Acidobacteriota bacterium]
MDRSAGRAPAAAAAALLVLAAGAAFAGPDGGQGAPRPGQVGAGPAVFAQDGALLAATSWDQAGLVVVDVARSQVDAFELRPAAGRILVALEPAEGVVLVLVCPAQAVGHRQKKAVWIVHGRDGLAVRVRGARYPAGVVHGREIAILVDLEFGA